MKPGEKEPAKPSLFDRVIDATMIPFLNLFCAPPLGLWGFFGLVLIVFAVGFQLKPGEELVRLGIAHEVYYWGIAILGALVGLLGSERRWIGVVAGAASAAGALIAQVVLHTYFTQDVPIRRMWAMTLGIGLVVGMIPGVALYAIVDALIPMKGDPTTPGETHRSQRRRRNQAKAATPTTAATPTEPSKPTAEP
jgi:hypothetical protein